MDIERLEEVAWGLEKRWRVVVAGGDDDMAAARFCSGFQKPVVDGLRPGRWGAVVEDIPGDEQNVNLFAGNQPCEPIKKGGGLLFTPAAAERHPQVPVGGMEDFQTDTPRVQEHVREDVGVRTLRGNPAELLGKNDGNGMPAEAIVRFGRQFVKNTSPAA